MTFTAHKRGLFALILIVVASVASVAAMQSVKNRFTPCSGANCDNVLEINGTIDIASGGVFKVAGTDRTANLTAAVASRTAAGEVALDGSGATPVTTGLTAITACSVTIKIGTSTGVDTHVLTYTTSTGTLSIWPWKPTSSSDTTLVASTGTQTVGWVCVGTV